MQEPAIAGDHANRTAPVFTRWCALRNSDRPEPIPPESK
jgi:hypothetical protein